VPLPAGIMTTREAMIYGTAGFTAAQCVTAIVDRGIGPERGEIVVTGATGGVGCLAVAILAKLGYRGLRDREAAQQDWLRDIGAGTILGREELADSSDFQPLLKSRWAAAVDTVGGGPLATIVRSLAYRGCVAGPGFVVGWWRVPSLPLSIYPFHLARRDARGDRLGEVPAAAARGDVWQKLSGPVAGRQSRSTGARGDTRRIAGEDCCDSGRAGRGADARGADIGKN